MHTYYTSPVYAGRRACGSPSYEYIHLCYPYKAKEAVCALNIDFKRKPCHKTAVKKDSSPPDFQLSVAILTESWKRQARKHDGLIRRRCETCIGSDSHQRQVAS